MEPTGAQRGDQGLLGAANVPVGGHGEIGACQRLIRET
jgi:hypothetical protein